MQATIIDQMEFVGDELLQYSASCDAVLNKNATTTFEKIITLTSNHHPSC
jgi:hypothetical protein